MAVHADNWKRSIEEEPLMRSRNGGPYTPNGASCASSEAESFSDSPVSSLAYSAYLDWQEKEKEKFQASLAPSIKSRRRRGAFFLGVIVIFLLVVASALVFIVFGKVASRSKSKHDGQSRQSFFMDLYIDKKAGPGTFPLNMHDLLPSDMCSICDCHASPAFYSPAKNFQAVLPARPQQKHLYPSSDSIDTNEFMRQTLLDIYCARQHLDPYQALKLLRRTRNLEELMSWSLTGLEFGKKTIYLTTATSSNGKAGPLRPQYFRRSGRAIRSWIAQQTAEAEQQNPGWQVVWIVAEDDVDIDPLVVRTLRRTGISYIYFAYGLTQSWGNAQKNAVYQVVYALSRSDESGGLFGTGPVYGLDDDNKIQPDLLGLLTRVDRIGVVPMGNLGLDMWERPVLDDLGSIVESESLWQEGRKYAFDYGGFSFNSSLLGTTISGPMFWKHRDFAGESEFIDQVIGNIRDLEPLCGRQQQQDCYLVWHNEPLLELEMMTDDEEIAYVKKYGADHLFQMLGLQSKEFEATKAEHYEPPFPELMF